MFFKDKVVILTGGSGFLGRYVLAELKSRGAENIFIPRSRDFDLRVAADISRMFQMVQQNYPDMPIIVIHMAAAVGGIGANMMNQGSFFYDNIMMGVQLIEESRRRNVYKFVQIGTVCSYPKYTPVPFKESDLWNGFPEETNAPYGIAKKALMQQIASYKSQYGFNGINLIPVNLYGPHDNFDPMTSHVIPGLIQKFSHAKSYRDKSVSVWGDGTPSREFLYVEDAARGIVSATELYDGAEPVNLGSGKEITIKDLVEIIAKKYDFEGEIIWDVSKPNGQPRRCLDTSRAWNEFGFRAEVDFEEGLDKTIAWYNDSQSKV